MDFDLGSIGVHHLLAKEHDVPVAGLQGLPQLLADSDALSVIKNNVTNLKKRKKNLYLFRGKLSLVLYKVLGRRFIRLS